MTINSVEYTQKTSISKEEYRMKKTDHMDDIVIVSAVRTTWNESWVGPGQMRLVKFDGKNSILNENHMCTGRQTQ
jgi:hypothetical protein